MLSLPLLHHQTLPWTLNMSARSANVPPCLPPGFLLVQPTCPSFLFLKGRKQGVVTSFTWDLDPHLAWDWRQKFFLKGLLLKYQDLKSLTIHAGRPVRNWFTWDSSWRHKTSFILSCGPVGLMVFIGLLALEYMFVKILKQVAPQNLQAMW